MIETTFTIKCDNEVIAHNVPLPYVGLIVEALGSKYYLSAMAGDLRIHVEAEGKED